MGRRHRLDYLPGEDPHTGAKGILFAAFAGRERQIRDGADSVQGLAAETQRDNAGEVVRRPDLARRVLRDRAARVFGRHHRAVVADPDQGHPTVLDLDLDSARPRVERVLDQLLDGGRRTLDDRSEEHTSELQSHSDLVCRLLLEKKKKKQNHSSTSKKKTKKEKN